MQLFLVSSGTLCTLLSRQRVFVGWGAAGGLHVGGEASAQVHCYYILGLFFNICLHVFSSSESVLDSWAV